MPLQLCCDRTWLLVLGDEPALSEDLLIAHRQAEAAGQAPDIVVDLTGVRRLNSSHLSQLLRLRKAVISRDGRLRLAAPSDAVWALFLTLGLEKVFEFAADV